VTSSDLGILYARHRRGILRVASKLLRDQAAAEDVVQETWVRAMRFFGTRATDGQPSAAWFYRVALNLCYDRLRALARDRTAVAEPAELDGGELAEAHAVGSGAPAVDPEQEVLRAELARAVREAVEGLPPLLREAVVLREYGGLKYREIAEIASCPVGTVMSRLHLARQRLRLALAPYLELDTDPAGEQADTDTGQAGQGGG